MQNKGVFRNSNRLDKNVIDTSSGKRGTDKSSVLECSVLMTQLTGQLSSITIVSYRNNNKLSGRGCFTTTNFLTEDESFGGRKVRNNLVVRKYLFKYKTNS